MIDELSQDLLHELFEYRDGELIWRAGRGRIVAGATAGPSSEDKYRKITINHSGYYAHRLIFLMHHGYLPKNVDHIDGDKHNNRIDNLREATIAENGWNAGISATNTSGYKGVSFNKTKRKWQVQVAKKGQRYHGGYHDTAEEANEAAIALREKLHGEYVRHE